MRHQLRDPFILPWALLVAVTLVSAGIGGPDPWIALDSAASVTVIVLAIAFAKVAAVMFAFMEVRGAPMLLRWLCIAWLCGVLGVLLALYFGVLA